MAKKPDDPLRPHSDDPSEPTPSSKSHPVPGEPGHSDSDSAIDLSQPGEGDVSGISIIEWAALVEKPETPPEPSKVSIDAASDADLLAHLGDYSTPRPRPAHEVVLPEHDYAELSGEAEFVADAEESAHRKPPAPAADDDDIFADLMAGRSHGNPPPAAPVAGPAAEHVEEDALFADLMAGSVDLTAGPPHGAEAEHPRVSAAEEEEAFADLMAGSVDLAAEPAHPAEPAEAEVAEAEAVEIADEGDVIFDLGASSSTDLAAPESGSFIDLAGEAIHEEVVDLGSGALVAEDAIELGSGAIIAEDVVELGSGSIATDDIVELGSGAIAEEEIVELGSGSIAADEIVEMGSGVFIADASDSVAGLVAEEIDLGHADFVAESSAVDLVEAGMVIDEPVSAAMGSGDIDFADEAIIVQEPSSDAAAIDLSSATLASEVAGFADEPIDIDLEAIVGEEYAEVSDDDIVELGDDVLVVEEASDSAAGMASGIDFASPTESSGPLSSESGVNYLNDILLEQPISPAPSSSLSSRDLIAEELESGTELRGAAGSARQEGEEDVIDDFMQDRLGGDQTSSVDLGSTPEIRLFEGDAPSSTGKARDSDIHIEELTDAVVEVGEDDYADINLDQIEETPAEKPAGKKRPTSVETDELEAFADELSPVEAFDEEEPVAPKKGKKARVVSEDEDVEEIAPKKKKGARAEEDEEAAPKPRGRAGAWIGGTFVGTLVGASACVGLLFSGLVPPEYLGQTGKEKTTTGPITQNTQPVEVGFDRTLEQIRNGDLDGVKPAELARVDENKPEELIARAEFHWLSYLRAERGKDPEAKLRGDAEPVKQALADLDKVIKGQSALARADALFLRGQIHEGVGNAAAARGDYEEGAKQFAADPAQKARFVNALSLMELTGRAMALPPGWQRDLLIGLLITLQPAPAPAPAPAMPDEAGYRFWEAIKLARDGKTAEAVKALDEARARHDQRRYLLPRKPQNPQSDPRQDIFLRACDELKAAWAYRAKLKNENYLEAEEKDRIPEVDALLTKASDAAKAEQIKTLAKLFKDKPVAKVEDLTGLIEAERKTAEADKLTLNTTVTDQKKKLDSLADDLKTADKKIATTEKALAETKAVAAKAQADSDAATAALKQVGTAVGTEFSDVKTSREVLLREVRETARIAKVTDPRGSIRQLEKDLGTDRAKLAQRWNPSDMLAFWVTILQKDRGRSDLAEQAMKDVARVLDDPASKDEAKAQALLVQGLAERNAEKFTEARATLTKARAGLLGSKGDWLAQTDEALDEVANPARDFARRAKALEDSGKTAEALAVLDRGVKTLPDRKGTLLLQRAKTAFETARSKGPIKLADPLVKSAQKDAAAAAEEGMAEGHFLAGRIAEELGQLDEAVKDYRAALKVHGKTDAEGSRYRIALARVLLKQRAAASGSSHLGSTRPEAVALERAALRHGVTIDVVGVLALLTLQAGDLPGEKPAASAEAEKLADEILALGDKAPFDARAQALAIKGLHTRALTVYTAGLRDNGLLSAEYANTLLDLINAHPVLRRPETLATANPAEATKHYSSGLNFFFSRKYASAERELLSAIENDKADARYYYFLGLSRLAQGNRDAFEDFDQGARLEQQGKPGRGAVSTALERVQGPLRTTLNDVRSRPVREFAK